jgi:hypothetical protein
MELPVSLQQSDRSFQLNIPSQKKLVAEGSFQGRRLISDAT